jgi:hypothetical protein
MAHPVVLTFVLKLSLAEAFSFGLLTTFERALMHVLADTLA